jgi:hypothetical protein
MATSNRSGVMRLAIETVRHQTEQDWQMWVIDDACTTTRPRSWRPSTIPGFSTGFSVG